MVIENIKKSYGKKKVLRDVSLNVSQGTCIGILGGNGCGKSTLLNILAGIFRADGGSFTYKGVDLFRIPKKRSEILGYVPQNTPLIDELSAKDNLRLWYTNSQLKYELTNGVLAMLGIDTFLSTPVCKMSGGMKKRLAIGCAVAHQPEILLLDEPSAALDLVCKAKISNYLTEFKERGGIILLATHDIQELSLCDSLYILKDGTLKQYSFDGNLNRLAASL